MLKPYELVKEVPAGWITTIPNHWTIERIGSIFTERKEKVSDKDYPPLSVTKNGILPQLANAAKSDDGDNRKLVLQGDFVINSRSDRKGSSGVSSLTGSVSLINIVLEPRIENNGKYLHYLLKNHKFIEEYYRNGRGIVADLWTTRFSEMKTILLPVPPKKEQDQIVRFLDWKLAKINKLIKAKKQQIVLLNEQKQAIINKAVTKGLDDTAPMKDSGVEWIGKVPVSWQIVHNKRIFIENIRNRFSENETVLSLSQKDGLIPYIDMKERSLHTATYENWKLVLKNDLVLNRFKAHLGVFFASKYCGIVTFHYGVYEPKIRLNSKYYEYLYHTEKFKAVYAGRSNGMTVGLQNLSNNNFYNVYTIFPSVEEQNKIVLYVQKVEKKVNRVIDKIEQELFLISEYRNSLISSVVTGKVDVRNIEVPDFVEETEVEEPDELEEAELLEDSEE